MNILILPFSLLALWQENELVGDLNVLDLENSPKNNFRRDEVLYFARKSGYSLR